MGPSEAAVNSETAILHFCMCSLSSAKNRKVKQETVLVWPHLIRPPAVLGLQALGTLPVLAVLSSSASSEGVWTLEVRNSARATPTRILTSHLTEEVRSVETPPRRGVRSAWSDAVISHTLLASPEDAALRVHAAAGSLQKNSCDDTLYRYLSTHRSTEE